MLKKGIQLGEKRQYVTSEAVTKNIAAFTLLSLGKGRYHVTRILKQAYGKVQVERN